MSIVEPSLDDLPANFDLNTEAVFEDEQPEDPDHLSAEAAFEPPSIEDSVEPMNPFPTEVAHS